MVIILYVLQSHLVDTLDACKHLSSSRVGVSQDVTRGHSDSSHLPLYMCAANVMNVNSKFLDKFCFRFLRQNYK